MNNRLHVALAGLVLLVPALAIVSTGLLDLDFAIPIFDNPVIVMGGLLGALALNTLAVFSVGLRQQEGAITATVSMRTRGSTLNLGAILLGLGLLAAITIYLFVENFTARI